MTGFNKTLWGRESKKLERNDYVPLADRSDWDGEVQVLRPYKDHKWTGTPFESKVGSPKTRSKRKGKMG